MQLGQLREREREKKNKLSTLCECKLKVAGIATMFLFLLRFATMAERKSKGALINPRRASQLLVCKELAQWARVW